MISRRAFVTGPSTRRGTATPVFAPRVISCVRDPGFGGYPSTILVTAWDRRRGRERETYTLQGYSPVLGNRPPELNSPGGLQKPVVLVSSNEGASPADQRGQGSRASTRYSIT